MAKFKLEPGTKIGAWVCVKLEKDVEEFRNASKLYRGTNSWHDYATMRCACGTEIRDEIQSWPEYRGEWELRNQLDCGCGAGKREARGRPYLAQNQRRAMVHWNLAPDVLEYVGDRAMAKRLPISRAAEEVIRAGMEKLSRRRASFDDTELSN